MWHCPTAEHSRHLQTLACIRLASRSSHGHLPFYAYPPVISSPQDAPRYEEGPPLQLHQALYWSWVTIATVGYGDYAPTTVVAQCLFPLVIVVMLLVLPAKISNLSAIMQVGVSPGVG